LKPFRTVVGGHNDGYQWVHISLNEGKFDRRIALAAATKELA